MTVTGCNALGTFDFVVGAEADPAGYFSAAAQDIRAQLLSEGAVLIRGATPCRDPEVFERPSVRWVFTRAITSAAALHARRSRARSWKRRTPPDWSVILHQEMAYVQHPPEIIAFVCVEPAERGGESVVGDMRKLEQLIDRATLQQLTDRGLKLRRTLPGEARVNLKPGVKKAGRRRSPLPAPPRQKCCAGRAVGTSSGVAAT
jgi:hypothetical protein